MTAASRSLLSLAVLRVYPTSGSRGNSRLDHPYKFGRAIAANIWAQHLFCLVSGVGDASQTECAARDPYDVNDSKRWPHVSRLVLRLFFFSFFGGDAQRTTCQRSVRLLGRCRLTYPRKPSHHMVAWLYPHCTRTLHARSVRFEAEL